MDRQWLCTHKLRYDLMVIPSFSLYCEWVKTKGHYHPRNPAGIGYPEVYEVFEDEVKYLLQSRRLDSVMISHAPGILSLSPKYGQLFVNPSPNT